MTKYNAVLGKVVKGSASAQVISLLHAHFEDDPVLVQAWLNTANVYLGGATPMELVRQGRIDSLLKFIREKLGCRDGT